MLSANAREKTNILSRECTVIVVILSYFWVRIFGSKLDCRQRPLSWARGNVMNRIIVVLLTLLQLMMSRLVASQSVRATTINGSQVQRIDTHCHFVPPFYRALLDSRNLSAGGLPIPSWNISAHLAANAEFGIVTSVLSISTPGAKLTRDDPVEEGRLLARQLNEYGKNLTVEYPKRFLFFATLTLPDLEGAVAEAIYALDTLKAAGVVLLASAFGELFGTTRYAPLYKVLDDRHTTVFIHPSNSPCPDESPTDLPPYAIDFLLDTSRAALELVYRNVTRDYPNITFILAHSGGFLPFAATRASGALAMLSHQLTAEAQKSYLEELSKFHVDLALSASGTALPSTTAFFNSTQITYGSDFPYAPVPGVALNNVGLQSFRLGNGARKRINYTNAYALFKTFLK